MYEGREANNYRVKWKDFLTAEKRKITFLLVLLRDCGVYLDRIPRDTSFILSQE